MHYLSGLIGIAFVVLALLSWQTPWIGVLFLTCSVLSFLAIRPVKVTWWLYTCCIAAALAAATLFARFFVQVEGVSDSNDTAIFDYALLIDFAAGFVMMYIVSEYSCWLKGRQERVKLKIPLRRWRERFRLIEEAPRSQ
ncbi:MAG: hypothetical protein F4W92_05035 [Gammaproteobacteria bacterium]|nr:hypothetical protein [Gammaproteobacteria bacterium]